MHKKLKPLNLSRHTVRTLGHDDLSGAVGAFDHTLNDCTYRVCSVGTCPGDIKTTTCPR